MSRNWTETLAATCPYEEIYPYFLYHLKPIQIRKSEVKGNVGIIGISGAFPEKTLIGTTESGYAKLRSAINSVFCCDPEYFSDPETQLDIPCINTTSIEKIKNPSPNTVYFENRSSYEFFPKIEPGSLDVVMMFRAVDTGKQVKDLGLVKSVAVSLKKGGLFICSGGRFPVNIPSHFFEPLTVVRSARLSDWSDGYPFTNNMGFVLRK